MSYEIKVAFWQILTAFITIKIVAGGKRVIEIAKDKLEIGNSYKGRRCDQRTHTHSKLITIEDRGLSLSLTHSDLHFILSLVQN